MFISYNSERIKIVFIRIFYNTFRLFFFLLSLVFISFAPLTCLILVPSTLASIFLTHLPPPTWL